ncbi:MAG: hypothetical protein L6V85_06470 [Clostridiales bacterium]|nr:MAG: hypothetical protein L6V85_06470 [Clostridiales bacterium]
MLYGIVREAKKKQAESGNAGATIVETASDEERLAAVFIKDKKAREKVEVYIGYDGNFETVYAFDKTTNTTTRTDDSGGANLRPPSPKKSQPQCLTKTKNRLSKKPSRRKSPA